MTPARNTELTGVFNRHLMDVMPPTITTEKDKARWAKFVEEYNATTELVVPDAPLQIDYEINSGCNLSCQFCTQRDNKRPNANTDQFVYRKIIRQASDMGIVSMKLNYINEPLLNPLLPEMIEYAHDHGFLNTYFATNGTLLSGRTADRLLDTRITKIMVSIDATTPLTYMRMRASGKYNVVVRNVREFIAKRNARGLKYPLVRVNFLKSPLNHHEQHAFQKMWEGIADMIGYQSIVGKPTAVAPIGYIPREFKCSFPFKMLVVTHDGYILPCCTFYGRTIPIGHASTMTLEQAWKSPLMNAIRSAHLSGAYASIHACKACINEGGQL